LSVSKLTDIKIQIGDYRHLRKNLRHSQLNL
jgi:hypothetical protein